MYVCVCVKLRTEGMCMGFMRKKPPCFLYILSVGKGGKGKTSF